MLKTILLAGTIAISAPVFAQSTTQPGRTPQTTPPAQTTTAPSSPATTATTPANDAAATPAQTTDAPTMPETDAASDAATTTTTPSAPTPASGNTAPATPPKAEAAAVTGASQVAQVIDAEFPSYDKNADGNLDKAEFGAWMVALKTASDPATKADAPATKTWVSGAFASADTDKSAVVTKTELTTYLSKSAG